MRCGTMVKIARLPRNRYLLSSRKGPHIRFVSCALSSQQIQWNPGSSTRKQPLSRNRTGEPINSAWIMVSTLHCLLWMIVGELTLSYLTICIIRVTLNSTEFDTIWLSRVCAKTTCLNLMRPFAHESPLTRVENDAPYNLKQFHVLTLGIVQGNRGSRGKLSPCHCKQFPCCLRKEFPYLNILD